MTARKKTWLGDDAGRVELVCDGCGATFSTGRFGTASTRLAAEGHGWTAVERPATPWRDYCGNCSTGASS